MYKGPAGSLEQPTGLLLPRRPNHNPARTPHVLSARGVARQADKQIGKSPVGLPWWEAGILVFAQASQPELGHQSAVVQGLRRPAADEIRE